MSWFTLLSSFSRNLTVPIPSAVEIPETSRTPMDLAGSEIDSNKSRWQQIWCVAQLSVPNVAGLVSKVNSVSVLSASSFASAIALFSIKHSATRHKRNECFDPFNRDRAHGCVQKYHLRCHRVQ